MTYDSRLRGWNNAKKVVKKVERKNFVDRHDGKSQKVKKGSIFSVPFIQLLAVTLLVELS